MVTLILILFFGSELFSFFYLLNVRKKHKEYLKREIQEAKAILEWFKKNRPRDTDKTLQIFINFQLKLIEDRTADL